MRTTSAPAALRALAAALLLAGCGGTKQASHDSGALDSSLEAGPVTGVGGSPGPGGTGGFETTGGGGSGASGSPGGGGGSGGITFDPCAFALITGTSPPCPACSPYSPAWDGACSQEGLVCEYQQSPNGGLGASCRCDRVADGGAELRFSCGL